MRPLFIAVALCCLFSLALSQTNPTSQNGVSYNGDSYRWTLPGTKIGTKGCGSRATILNSIASYTRIFGDTTTRWFDLVPEISVENFGAVPTPELVGQLTPPDLLLFVQGFLLGQKSDLTTTYYWATRHWIGTVSGRPNDETTKQTIQKSDTDASYNALALRETAPNVGTGWFTKQVEEELWAFDLADPAGNNNGTIKIYHRLNSDNRQFRSILYEKNQNLLWILCENDVIWVDPTAPLPESSDPVAEPSNGKVQNILTGASLRTILYYQKQNMIYMAGNAYVFRTPITNNGWRSQFRKLDLEYKLIGAGIYYTGVINDQLDKMYLGSSLGIGVEIDLPTFSLRRIFFAPGESFLSVYLDLDHQATFWSTDKATVARVNTDDFLIFAKITVSGTSNLKASAFDPTTRLLHFAADFGFRQETFPVHMANCTPYDCRDCFTVDTQYCGVCRQTGICTVVQDCISPFEWEPNGFCPELLSVTPSRGSISGGTLVTISGSSFEQTDTLCFVDTPHQGRLQFSPSSIGPNFVVCSMPAITGINSTTQTVDVKVGVLWASGRVWGTPLTFTYYNCFSMTCGTCFQTTGGNRDFPECGWCVGDFSCQPASGCTNPNVWSPSKCPAVALPAPGSGNAFGAPLTVPIDTTAMMPGANFDNYFCQFGSQPLVQATGFTASPPAVTCPSPDVTTLLGSNDSLVLSLSVYVSPDTSSANAVLFTPISAPFTAYDCNALKTCDACALRSLCRWCSNELTCTFIANPGANPTCNGAHGCFGLPQDGVTPKSAFYTTYSAVEITLTGTNFANIAFECAFQFGTSGSVLVTPATFIDTEHITCNTPAAQPATAGDYSLWLQTSLPVRLTPKIPFLFYTCSVTSCSDCLDTRRSQCEWCNTPGSLSCGDVTGCTNPINRGGVCPTATSASPDNDALEGTNQIRISGALQLETANISSLSMSCEFLPPAGNSIKTDAVVAADGSSLTCPSPATNVTGAWSVRATMGSYSYSTSTPFTYYDCSSLSTCDACAAKPQCSWCATKCTARVACLPAEKIAARCPVIDTVQPAVSSSDGGDTITVIGGSFVQAGSSTYTCLIGGVFTIGTRAADDKLECITPRIPTGPASVAVYLDGSPYTATQGSVNFFACPVGTTTSCFDSCGVAANCGWCVTSPSCTSQTKCGGGGGLWVQKCLAPELVQDHAAISGNESIVIRFDNTLSPFPLVSPADISCDFGIYHSELKEVRQDANGNTVIVCYSPEVRGPSTVQLTVSYRGSTLLNRPFAFIDCATFRECSECRQNEHCGWCLGENKCSTAQTCPTINWMDQDCPSILSFDPDTAYPEQETTVTITGVGFVPSDQIYVRIDGKDIRPTNMVTTKAARFEGEIVFIAPGTDDKKPKDPIDVDIRFGNGSIYATAVAYKYVNPNAVDPAALGGGLAAGLVVLGAVGGIAFWKLRQKYRGAVTVVVKEPDYSVVAWGNDVIPRFRIPEDGYKKLETSLSRSDFALQLAIQAECPPTEQESVAKSLVHVAHPSAKAVDLINCLVKVEVASCIQENTIFRGNSLVSKMFKFYSRVVGIRYLFRSMARVIAELETLGLKEARKKAKGQKSDGNSLLTVTMELDPNKMEDMESLDADTNLLQLQLTCQKIFAAIMKSGTEGFPVEFRKIFVQIDHEMMTKFGSDQASFKAIGGFFFLRFVCPAITAPHVYGLLETPPNVLTQRQLVLISKVIQSVANMAMPGKKEKYMESLSGFIETGIPKMTKFYEEIRKPQRMDEGLVDMPTPKEVKSNALAALWGFIYQTQDKIKLACGNVGLDRALEDEIVGTIEELVYEYKTAPKKLDATKKKRKGKSAATPAPDL